MNKPQTKQMWMPYINEEGTGITIGGFQYGIGRELETETPEELLALLKFMDGSRTLSEISNFLKMSFQETLDLLKHLQTFGLLQENIVDNQVFSQEEAKYYKRNLNFFSWIDVEGKYYNYWAVQEKLKNARVLLLGAGGTGSICANSFVRLGIGNIRIVDFDIVEMDNLNRQFFTYEDVGRNKVDALHDSLVKINPFVNVEVESKKISSTEDLLSLGTDYDLLVCCIDKPETINELVEDYTLKTGIPRVMGGYASTVVTASLFTESSATYKEIFENQKKKSYDSFKVNTSVEWQWENAIIAPIASLAGNLSALYAFYFLSDLTSLKASEILHLDLYNVQNAQIAYSIKNEVSEEEYA